MKASNPLVSFVIPCFNDFQYVEQSVNSALHQTYKNIEVIVVDDGSNAKTKAVLKTIEPKIAKLITQENKGQSTARNRGVANAKGDYIVVLDSDDYFEPTFCEKAIEIIINNTEVKLVTCSVNILESNGKVTFFEPKGGSVVNFLTTNSALGSLMFRKVDFMFIDGYDVSMRRGFEDWEFYLRLLKNGGETYVIKDRLFNYRKRRISTTSRANKVKYELTKFIQIKNKAVISEHIETYINEVYAKLELEEQSKIKQQNKIDFKLGKAILKPLRFFKSFFN
ncbi:glycosyltransferase family 2 protein [Olleya sp. HaHaR_3_96]|uniref:glycosyltransferase family 2 protein n=1 Tax=Olleya sp. HaHaR_3_96 TaxID=2745560 RepID=UPI001C4E60DE|nr:glycosyltransferase family A protein [Olleya sp. HaHaR_3_96]QXP61681.1 glycosyltransferase family 2 protein [Olleya sp. HaHaR_3_96]